MKSTTTQGASKASHKRARKNLDVTPAKGGTVRGGFYAVEHGVEHGGTVRGGQTFMKIKLNDVLITGA
jgi:hypothetical protein